MENEKTEMVTEPVVDTTDTKSTEPTIETVESLKAELEGARKALKNANKEAASSRIKLEAYEKAELERKQSEMSELEKAQARIAELEGEIKARKSKDAKLEAAKKVGLPETFASRLQGETPEELEADAKLILEALPKPEKPAPGIQPTNPPEGTTTETIAQKKVRIFGGESGMDVFDPTWSREHGGGVVLLNKE